MPAIQDFVVDQSRNIYSVCFRKSRPADICSQIRSTIYIVNWLIREGILRSGTNDLLILGGGIAGIAAALAAAEQNISSMVLELGKLVGVQRGCSSRFLYPNLYRWPSPEWEQSDFLPPNNLDGLAWSNGAAHNIGQAFYRVYRKQSFLVRDLVKYRSYNSRFTRARTLAQLVEQISIEFDHRPTFGAALIAVGCVEENCTVRGYTGPSFWQSDELEQLVPKPDDKWVVSGSGDGALQDFIRLSTGQPIHILADKLLKNPGLALRIWLNDLLRSLVANTETWNEELKNHLQALPSSIWNSWIPILNASVRDIVPRLIIRGSCISPAYPLNVFLVLVIERWWREVKGCKSCLMYNSEIFQVTNSTSRGGGRIEFTPLSNCNPIDASLIIIRHGIFDYI